jgi:hypothetical protein
MVAKSDVGLAYGHHILFLKVNRKLGALIGLGLYLNEPVVVVGYPFADGQTQTRSLNIWRRFPAVGTGKIS